MTIISKINPANKEEEKKKFLFDPLYNPQFEYEYEFSQEEYERFGAITDQFLDVSKHILDSVIKKYGSEDNFLEEAEGEIITKDEVESIIAQYLKENEIESVLKVNFTRNAVSRTSIDQDNLYIRLPIDYRKKTFIGVLHHEIGTHYFRTLNERRSPWYEKRAEFHMRPKTQSEEGLAMLNQMIVHPDPYFWLTALYYYASWIGNQASFADLNKELQKYVEDPERRWKVCLRIKRGIKDTSLPGAFSRNQQYLVGVIKVLHYLEQHEYNPEPLYAGKIDVQDVERARDLSPGRDYLLPKFIKDMPREEYKKGIQRIKKLNFPNTKDA